MHPDENRAWAEMARKRVAESKPPVPVAKKRPLLEANKVGPSEDEIQQAYFAWAAAGQATVPDLAKLFAVPNGGHRTAAVAGKLKATGVRRGVPDILLPVPRGGFVGLACELKSFDGRPSVDQVRRLDEFQRDGWMAIVCWSLEAAQQATLRYLAFPKQTYQVPT